MNAATIYRKLRELVAETLGVEEEDVVPEASYRDDLSADAQELAELIAAIEETFEVTVPDDEIENLQTVGSTLEFLEDALA